MPTPVSLDRDLCKTLVLQGIPVKEIAAQTGVTIGVINVWKHRYGWGKLLQAKEAIVLAHQTKLDQPKPEHSERLKNGIAEELVKDLELVESKPAKTLSEARNRQGVLSTMAGTAKIVCGWTDTVINQTFNFPLMDSARLDTTPAIDVQSQAVDTKPVTPEPAPVEPAQQGK